MPPLADLSFAGLDDYVYRPTANKACSSISKGEPSVIKTSNISVEMPKIDSVRTSGVIIKDWFSDDEDTLVDTQVDSQTTVKPSFKKIKFTKARNESVQSNKQVEKPKMVTQNSKAERKYWNGNLTQKPRISKETVNNVRINGVNTDGQTLVSTVEGNGVTAIKTSTEQFWQTAALSTIKDGVMAITATIDINVMVLIIGASIRRHLKLGDSEGLSTLPTEEIFQQLAHMGPKKTDWEQVNSNIATAIICLARDKGKAVMQESEPTKKNKKRIQVQMSINEELAQKLHKEELARFNAEQEAIDIARKEKVVAEEVKRSKRTVQKVKRQSIEEEKGKKSNDSSKLIRKKTLARKRAGGNDSQERVKKQKLEDDTEKKELKLIWIYEMLDDFDRQDVMDLYRLVEERYTTTSLEGYDLMLWGDLMTLFELDEENELWKNQHEYNLISWRLCDSSGIHFFMDNGIAIHTLIEKKYPLG
uniref:Uncharacterized protein n=1 Tax=Tanacetum cinerariifolium TaxID=118510 RepID=A0A699I538_TANCI|nr:hypothetical protein [Tanacetum cinerariifolium]